MSISEVIANLGSMKLYRYIQIVGSYYSLYDEWERCCCPIYSSSFIHKTVDKEFSDPVLDNIERKLYLEKIICCVHYAARESKEDVEMKDWIDFVVNVCGGRQEDINDEAKRRLGKFFAAFDKKYQST